MIGIGEDGLDGLAPAARTLVETAEVLVGGARHLAMVPAGAAERLAWRQPLADTIAEIAARRGRRVVVLASGDPLWYGVGVCSLRHFAREEMTMLPQPERLQPRGGAARLAARGLRDAEPPRPAARHAAAASCARAAASWS